MLMPTLNLKSKIIGIAEIANLAEISQPAVCNWIKRHEDFPKPLIRLQMGPVYNKHEIITWLKEYRKNGINRRKGIKVR